MNIDYAREFRRYKRIIKKHCPDHVFLIGGIIWKESTFNPLISRKEPRYYDKYIGKSEEWQQRMRDLNLSPWDLCTSVGLMQVLWPTAWEVGYRDEPWKLFEPATNIKIGCRYFNKKLKKYGSQGIEFVIAAYNAGTPRVTKKGVFRNQKYVDVVRENAATLEMMFRLQNRRNTESGNG